MSAADILAKLIRQRYDMCGSSAKYPMEDSLAEYIAEHAAAAGLAVIELPESDRGWGRYDAFTVNESYVVAAMPDRVMLEDEDAVTAFTAVSAERLAAALLAAAHACEAVSS